VGAIRTGLLVVLALGAGGPASARPLERWFHPADELARVNRSLHGRVVDYTCNHGADRRIWSAALGERRDLYVYLPPHYSPHKQYPLVIYLHGFGQDEESFLKFVNLFDGAMACGKLPPFVIAAPDGSIRGKPSLLNAGSFYVNSKAGRFEDFVIQDVWNFIHERYPIRPERGAHAFVGGSMGGFAAFNLGIKYREVVGVVAGVLPPLNLRYLDCRGRYFAPFDPNCVGWRDELKPFAAIGRFAGGLVVVRERRMTDPLFGRAPDTIAKIAAENPAEMLATYDVKPGELEMFVGYAGRDEFNLNAQAESFLYLAKCRGLCVATVYLPNGRHNTETGKKMIPYLNEWLAPRLAPYAPPLR
jgi:S-formylglutathione hydrolase FrmB